MRKNKFGTTGLEVTAIGFGAGHIGDGSIMDEKQAEKLLNEVLDEGVNLIDTARGYGLSEERIGRYIAHRRDEYILSTKIGYSVEGYEDWTAACITAGVDLALRTLQTDVLDIVHLHSCPIEVLQQGDVVEALLRAVEAGKIRYAAYSGENEALAYALNSGAFHSLQCSVNICDQRVIEDVLPIAANTGLGIIAKRPIANAPWRYAELPKGLYCEEYWRRLKSMNLDPGEYSYNEMALRFTAFTKGVSSSIIGTSSITHLREHIANLAKGPLPEEVYADIRTAFKTNDSEWIGQV